MLAEFEADSIAAIDSVVKIALLSNWGPQASYDNLPLAGPVLVQESLQRSPTLSEIARLRFPQGQLHVAEETLRLTAYIRRTYFRAAANALVELLTAAKSTAASTTQLQKHPGGLDGHKKNKEGRRCKKVRRRPRCSIANYSHGKLSAAMLPGRGMVSMARE